jgi:hypothetical protein
MFQAPCSGPALTAHGRSFVHACDAFDNLFIPSDGSNDAIADHALLDKRGDLIVFSLTNPALVVRNRHDDALKPPVKPTFHVPGLKGYADYRALAA